MDYDSSTYEFGIEGNGSSSDALHNEPIDFLAARRLLPLFAILDLGIGTEGCDTR
jgi:hypothetical protein